MTETADLPRDPSGWRVELTADGQWLPVRIADDHPLDAQPTKEAAVAAIHELVPPPVPEPEGEENVYD